MTLAVVIGNTNARLTWFEDEGPLHRLAVPTDRFLLDAAGFAGAHRPVGQVAVATVVPRARHVVRAALTGRLGLEPFVMGPASQTGLQINYARRQLGDDRICVVVGARQLHQGNAVVVDFGTAVTLNVVTERAEYLGGAILPGLELMLDSLNTGTARLPRVPARAEGGLIATDTRTGLQAGTYNLLALGLLGILAGIDRERGVRHRLFVTGGGAPLMLDRLPPRLVHDPDLAARGLLRIHALNR